MKPLVRALQRFIYETGNEVQLVDCSSIPVDPALAERNKRERDEKVRQLGPRYVLHNPNPPQSAANDSEAA